MSDNGNGMHTVRFPACSRLILDTPWSWDVEGDSILFSEVYLILLNVSVQENHTQNPEPVPETELTVKYFFLLPIVD